VPLLPPALVAVLLVLALLALIPTRHLFRRGASGGLVAGYFLALWLLGVAVVATQGRARILLPVVLVLAVVPYFHLRDGIDRLLGRPPRQPAPPVKNVTPPEDEIHDTGATR
jgi:membrane protein implicated in regulation of membrane protease activity